MPTRIRRRLGPYTVITKAKPQADPGKQARGITQSHYPVCRVNPTRPMTPGSSSSKHGAGLSARMACWRAADPAARDSWLCRALSASAGPFPVVMRDNQALTANASHSDPSRFAWGQKRLEGRTTVMATLRLTHQLDGTEHVVDMALEGLGTRQTAEARFAFRLTDQDEEDLRWYLEDYLQYPVDPAPQIAARVEGRLAELGRSLFTALFQANRETIGLWEAVAGWLADTNLAVASGAEGAAAIPWELLRDPATDTVLALQTK
jgi:hypothetical protein